MIRSRLSSAPCIAFTIAVSCAALAHPAPARADELIEIPVLVNVLGNMNPAPTADQIEEMIRSANGILAQAGIRLQFDKNTDIKTNVGDTGNNNGTADANELDNLARNARNELDQHMRNKGLPPGKGVKIILANNIANTGPGNLAETPHNPDGLPITIIKFPAPTETLGLPPRHAHTLAHELCHMFTLGKGHVVDRATGVTADRAGHHASRDNLMAGGQWELAQNGEFPLNDGRRANPTGSTLTEDQKREIRDRARRRGTVRETEAPPPAPRLTAADLRVASAAQTAARLATMDGVWTDVLGDVATARVDLRAGSLFAEPNGELFVNISVGALHSDSTDVVSRFEVLFNTDNSTATGVTSGAVSGIDRTLRITLSGRYPFTGAAGALTAELCSGLDTSCSPLPAGIVNRVEVFHCAGILGEASDAPDVYDAIEQTLPVSLLGTLAAQVPAGIRSTDVGTAQSDEASFIFVTNPGTMPAVSASPLAGRAGTMVTVVGSNFSASSAIAVLVDDDQVATGTSDGSGAFSITFPVPAFLAARQHFVTARDATGRFDFSPFEQLGPPIAPASGLVAGGTRVLITGTGFAGPATVTFGGVAATAVQVLTPTLISAVAPAHAAGAVTVAVSTAGTSQTLTNGYTYVNAPASATTDTDNDLMPDEWELRYGLDRSDFNDAVDDPDRDGIINQDEFRAGSHPFGHVRRYLAEGATSAFFNASLALLNTSPDIAATVLVRFLKTDRTTVSHSLTIPPLTRRTIDAKSIPGLATAEFSIVVEADVTVVVDRTMSWDGSGYGSHAETGLVSPHVNWYFAEGATHSGFDLFYLIQNPNATAASLTVTYLLPGGATPLVKTYSVPANSRFNIWVDLESPALAATDVSARIVSDLPVIAERAMYLNAGGRLFGAGHESAGVNAPATSWFLAEGATGAFFDLFVLIANPNAQAAEVTATYRLPGGATVTKTYTVPANSRSNIWVDLEHPALADTAVSTTITSTNGVAVIVERAMWWPGTAATWHEAHNSPGALLTGTRWALAEGELGGAAGIETYILIANTSSFAGSARVTLYFDDGTTAERTYALAGSSRFSVNVGGEFPAAGGRKFGAIIESLAVSGNTAQLVVERAMYSNANGVVWAAGTNALATRLQ